MRRILPFLFCCSCGIQPTISPWKLDAIAAGDASYNSARLIYQAPTSDSPFRLEFLRLGSSIDLFISMVHFTLAPSLSDPSSAPVRLQFGDDPSFEESIPLLEGRMRLHFPEELTEKITRALQEEKKVSILVDGFEETIEPERFSKLYEKFTSRTVFLRNPFKGPVE